MNGKQTRPVARHAVAAVRHRRRDEIGSLNQRFVDRDHLPVDCRKQRGQAHIRPNICACPFSLFPRIRRAAKPPAELSAGQMKAASATPRSRIPIKPVLSTYTALRLSTSSATETPGAEFPVIDASLRMTLGEVYEKLGRAEETLALSRRAYALRVDSQGEEQRDTLHSLAAVGAALSALQQMDEAESTLRRALESCRRMRVLLDIDITRCPCCGATLYRQELQPSVPSLAEPCLPLRAGNFRLWDTSTGCDCEGTAQAWPSAALRRLPRAPALQTSDRHLTPTVSVTPGPSAATHSTHLPV